LQLSGVEEEGTGGAPAGDGRVFRHLIFRSCVGRYCACSLKEPRSRAEALPSFCTLRIEEW
jgi:hypothetical protein